MNYVTQWFSGKPHRKGVYERFTWGGYPRLYAYWDGKSWGPTCLTPTEAANSSASGGFPGMAGYWRGIAK